MKSHTEYLTFHLPARVGFVNITPQVEAAVRTSGVAEGLVLVKTKNTALRARSAGPGVRR